MSNYKVALAPSRFLAAFVLAGAGATIALLMVLPLEPLPRALVVVWVGLAAPRAMRENVARVVDLASVVDGSFVAPWLTIIRWRPEGAWFDRTIVVLPDMLPADAFRELRLRLRWDRISR
jgi:hypothetical protein